MFVVSDFTYVCPVDIARTQAPIFVHFIFPSGLLHDFLHDVIVGLQFEGVVFALKHVDVDVVHRLAGRMGQLSLFIDGLVLAQSVVDVLLQLQRQLRLKGSERSLPPVLRQRLLQEAVAALLFDLLNHLLSAVLLLDWNVPERSLALHWLENTKEQINHILALRVTKVVRVMTLNRSANLSK